MVGFGNVWAVYGIGAGVVGRDGEHSGCTSCIAQTSPSTTTSAQTSSFGTPLPASYITTATVFQLSIPTAQPSNDTATSPGHPPHGPLQIPPPSPSSLSPSTLAHLSTAVKAGIITASIIVFLLICLILFGYTYLHRKRRERALQRAVEEVERGTELKGMSLSESGESKENMVLESRVEILVDGETETDNEEGWDGENEWDADTDGQDSDGDLGEWGRGRAWERGRNGMSLPRRED
ncbi:hypothetical protein EJ02DRAFT_500897 [Clathrospora elynae]|uniref:Uncharacterized protein n=1 Tax=Clathrospora elynae TaxID=706981 RepID=A0A6A5SYT7_9PLEO|nr:hypothetical protein EJ02DRAFT_500897 [Clathrospora elynae]